MKLMVRYLSLVFTVVGILMLTAQSSPAGIYLVSNGSAPPDPTNVIDDATYSGDWVYVRNVGCSAGWPPGDPAFDCPTPGDATTLELAPGGFVLSMYVDESSSILLSGGDVAEKVETRGSSSVRMDAGSVGDFVNTWDNSTFTIVGGVADRFYTHDNSKLFIRGGGASSALPTLLAEGTSTITIIGTGFMVDGLAVPLGDLTATSGILTGTLESGETLTADFRQGGLSYTGTIRIVPEPGTGLLLMLGLVGFTLGRRTFRD